MKMWIARTMGDDLQFIYGNIYEQPIYNELEGLWEAWEYDSQFDAYKTHGSWINPQLYPEVTFENSPMEVEIIEKSTLDEVYKGLDQYENFLGMVACMRRAQKEANDMIAQVECYEEAMEHVKKAEELESMVDKWLEGEAL